MGFGLVNNIVRVIISVWLIVVIEQARFGDGSTLTPPYFNLAEGKNISASSTCGVGIEQGRELYCKLVGANTDNEANINLIQGQVNINTKQFLDPLFLAHSSIHIDSFNILSIVHSYARFFPSAQL